MKSLILVAVIFGLGSVVHGQMMDRFMDFFKGRAKTVKDRLLMKGIDELKEGNNLGEVNVTMKMKLKTALSTGNFMEQGIQSKDLLASVPKEVFQCCVRPEVLMMMGRDNVENLIEFGGLNFPENLNGMLVTMRDANGTMADVINKLRGALASESNSIKKLMLISRLGDPEDITKENITALKPILFLLSNSWFMRIDDEEVVDELFRQAMLCISNGDSSENKASSCPSVNEASGSTVTPKSRKFQDLLYYLYLEKYGDPDDWTEAEFKTMNLDRVPATLLLEVDDDVLHSKKADLVNRLQRSDTLKNMYGTEFAEKIARAEGLDEFTNSAAFKTAMVTLGSPLNTMIGLNVVNPQVLSDTEIAKTINQNTQNNIKRGNFNAMDMKIITKQSIEKGTPLTTADIQTMGPELLAAVDASAISTAIENNLIGNQQLRELADNVDKYNGPEKYGKFRKMMPRMITAFRVGSSIDINSFPRSMIPIIPPNQFFRFSGGSASSALTRNVELPSLVTSRLINTVSTSSLSSLDPNGKSFVSLSKMAGRSSDTAKLAEVLPSMHPLSRKAVEDVFATRNEITNRDLEQNMRLVRLLGRDQCMKFKPEELTQIMETIKDELPTIECCYAMKELFVNNSRDNLNTMTEEEALLILLPNDIEQMPVCVITAFGKITDELDDISKQILYNNLAKLGKKVFVSTGIRVEAAISILKEGLEARDQESLSATDLIQLQELIIFTPPKVLETLEENALPEFIRLINQLASTPLMPCLDNRRQEAIGKLIMDYQREEPEDWKDIRAINCLLNFLPPGVRNRIDSSVKSSSTCDLKKDMNIYASLADIQMRDCRRKGLPDRKKQEMDIMRMQQKESLKSIDYRPKTARRKRAIGDIPLCARAAITGADDIHHGELERLTQETLDMCLADICMKPLPESKSRIVVRKLKDTLQDKSITSITSQQLENLNFCLRGITAAEIKQLPPLRTSEFDNVVAALGAIKKMNKGFNMDQKREALDKILTTWKTQIGSWSYSDIQMVGGLICEMDVDQIENFSPNSVKEAIPFLRQLDCPMEQMNALLSEVESAYGVNMNQWTSSRVSEAGRLLAGSDPEKLKSLPASAFVGMEPSTIESIPGPVLGVISVDQAMNLESATAMAVTGGQKSHLSAEVCATINAAELSDTNGAFEMAAYTTLIVSCLWMVLSSSYVQHN